MIRWVVRFPGDIPGAYAAELARYVEAMQHDRKWHTLVLSNGGSLEDVTRRVPVAVKNAQKRLR